MILSFFGKNQQLVKFLVVGCTNFLVSFTVYNFCYMHLKLGSMILSGNAIPGVTFDAALANVVGYTCGILNSFIWNKVWTFKAKYNVAKQFYNFIILNISCLLLSTGVITFFVDILGAPHKLVWLYTMFLVTFVNYIICKKWVFNKKTYRN